MFKKILNLLEKTNNVKRSSYFWNAASAGVLAIQSPIILMVISRTTELKDAGIFSIGIAVSNLMMYLGQYGLRRFQSSDIKEKYKFEEYHGMRIITCILMIIASVIYCMYGKAFLSYTWNKISVIFLICVLRLIQAYTDVYHGQMQQRGRLDVATRSSTIRYIFEMIVYCIGLVVTHNLLVSTTLALAISILVMFVTTLNAAQNYCESYRPSFHREQLKLLAIEGFPLFVSMFLNMYVGNIAKYGIDAYLGDEIQGIFNMIFMPAYVIQLIAHFIFNPILTTYAELWHSVREEDHYKLKKLINRQILIIFGLLALALLVSVTIALPILSFLFSVDLNAYKMELCVIMVGGAMLAFATYFSTIIAIIREQKSLMICYITVSIIAKLLSKTLIVKYEMIGASVLYAIVMLLLAAALYIVVKRGLKTFNKA